MKKLTYILLLSVLAFSCQREDVIDGAAVSFYPTVVSSGSEQDENTYVMNLATSQFINGTANVKIQVEMTADGVIETTPPMEGNIISLDITDNNTAQIFFTLENDATPEDYTAVFRIVDASSGLQPSSTNKYTVFVTDTDSVPLFEEDFDDCPDYEGISIYSTAGDQAWDCTNFGRIIGGSNTPGLRMNGFVSGSGAQNNEDWIITDPLNLLGQSSVSASFYSDLAFGGPDLELRVSTNYSGGNPTSANWTTLDATLDEDTGFDTWTFSGNISLNDYISANTSVAIVYLSSEAEGAAQWTIDDFSVSTFNADASNGGTSAVVDVPFTTDFEGCTSDFSVPSGFDELFASGTKTDTGWGCRQEGVDGGRAVRVIGSGGSQLGDVDAWLITESRYDFRGLPGAQLTFDIKSESSGDGQLRVYHTDFYLGGDPTNYDWTEITGVTGQLPTKGSDTYTEVSVSVPEVSGTKSFFAFRLDGASATNSASYDIDNVSIEAVEAIVFNLPFTDDFEECGSVSEYEILDGWIEVNAAGTKTDRGWGCRGFGNNDSNAPAASAFGGESGADDAWLISDGKIDLTGITSASMELWVESPFSGGGTLKAYWSSDYTGSGDPTTNGTWNELTDLPAQLPSGGSRVWTQTTSSLTPAVGNEVYIAFRYEADNTAGSVISYNIDDLEITGN